MPYDNNYRYKRTIFKSKVYMPLTLPYLAALTPDKECFEFKIVDEGVQECDYSRLEHFGIVAITVIISSAPRAYQLAAHFRAKNSHVVIGAIM